VNRAIGEHAVECPGRRENGYRSFANLPRIQTTQRTHLQRTTAQEGAYDHRDLVEMRGHDHTRSFAEVDDQVALGVGPMLAAEFPQVGRNARTDCFFLAGRAGGAHEFLEQSERVHGFDFSLSRRTAGISGRSTPKTMALFDPIAFRGVTLPNRIAVSPMCMYSSVDGMPNDWHFVHLGSRAVGGSGLVLTEASAVVPEGRISPDDAGMYRDEHVDAWGRVTRFVKEHGSIAGIQLAHAGRKASMSSPWKGSKLVPPSEGGWAPVYGPSTIPFSEHYATPTALDETGIAAVVGAFRKAAERSLAAGFELVELHGAHGYLLHSFASPLSNERKDGYGGSFANRTRLHREVVGAVREVWPDRLPLFMRISCTDWAEGGWDLEQSIELSRSMKELGVDLIDCSSGGNVARAKIPAGPNYQVPFAEAIRAKAGIPTGAVGFITEPEQAEAIVAGGQADLVFLARANLRNPYWPQLAAQQLGVEVKAPVQYVRAW